MPYRNPAAWASFDVVRHVQLDTEFADLDRPCLISIGLVEQAGEHRYYAELRDTWQPSRCSAFVHQYVLPKLEGPRHFRQQVGREFYAWIAAFPAPVLICTDAAWYDFGALVQLLNACPKGWPANLIRTPVELHWAPDWRSAIVGVAKADLRAHHALDDAELHRRAWQSWTKRYWQRPLPKPDHRSEFSRWQRGYDAAKHQRFDFRRDELWWQGFLQGLDPTSDSTRIR
jgi:hypothetical protein